MIASRLLRGDPFTVITAPETAQCFALAKKLGARIREINERGSVVDGEGIVSIRIAFAPRSPMIPKYASSGTSSIGRQVPSDGRRITTTRRCKARLRMLA